jgi:iron complex outermembrane receptor protein
MTKDFFRGSSLAGIIAGMIIAGSAPAVAQTAAAGENDTGLADIIVTARKVSENLQTVPVAVTALSADAIKNAGITNVFDIQGKVPNLYLQNSAIDAAGLTVALRGQKQNDFILTVDPSVGLYVDGFYHPRTYGMRSALVDVERLEVLRGPQGTLYGRNTTGGALSIYSAQPSDEFGASIQLKGGNYGFFEGTAIANVPLGEGLSSRFVVQHGEQDGLGSDGLSNDVASENRTYVRGKIKAGGGSIRAVLTGVYSRVHTGGALLKLSGLAPASSCPTRGLNGCIAAFQAVAELYGLAGLANPAQRAAGAAALESFLGGDPLKSGSLYKAFSTYESEEVNLDVSADLSDTITLRSLTGYQHFKRGNNTDDDGTPFTILNATQRTREEYVSQEVQLLGDMNPLQWVIGAYFGRETGREVSTSVAIPLLNPSSTITDGQVINRSLAVFAQATWAFATDSRVTAGVRYSSDRRTLITRTRDSTGVCLVPTGALTGAPTNPANGPAMCPRTFQNTYSKPSWLISADHRFSPELFAYAKVARGYRTGGQNLRGTFVETSFQPFAPEIVTEYEVGIKTDLLDRRLRINIAAFYDDYKNIQRSITIPTLRPSPSTIVTNAAKGEIKGIEAELEAKLSSMFSVGGSASLTDAKYKKFIDLIGDRTDESFGVPKWMASVHAQVNAPTSLGDLTGQISYDWQSTTVLAPDAQFDSQVTQKAYGLLNGRVALDLDEINGTVAVYGRNMLNKKYASGAIAVDRALGFNAVVYGEPARVGVELTLRLGGMR